MGGSSAAQCIGGEFLMADYLTTDTELTSIANAIRTKGGTSAALTYPAGFVSAIQNITTGGNDFVVTLTQNSSTGNWEPDKTFAQLSAARTNGDIITLTFDGEPTGYTTVPIQWDWYDNGATFWYYTCWPDFDNIVGADGAWVHDSYYFTANGLNRDSRSIFEEPKILGTKTITANGTYNAIMDAKDGYSSVTVNVPGPSGSTNITQNGTYNVTNYAEAVVNVPGGGATKNSQIASGVGRVASASYVAANGQTLTVAKTGTYNVYWVGYRSNTGGTSGSQLYIDEAAYGSANTTFNGTYANAQINLLTNVQLTADQVIEVRARSRSTSYYMYIMNLTIIEV